MQDMIYDGWPVLVRTAVVGSLAYVALVLILRISGNRTLSKLNAFDFVVTVALGSTLATILLSRDTALSQGVLAMALLVGLQYAVTWTSVRMAWVRRFVTGEPLLLLHRGQLLERALKQARLTEADVRVALRGAGLRSFEQAEAVVLETDASLSVIQRSADAGGAGNGSAPSLQDVRRHPG